MTWKEYWAKFDRLCEELERSGRSDIARALRDAELRVTGLTDGWHDFIDAFDQVLRQKGEFLSPEQSITARALFRDVKRALRGR